MFYSTGQVKELLICSVCENAFTDPRVLPCGETFCNKCIESSQDKVFKCLCEKKVI